MLAVQTPKSLYWRDSSLLLSYCSANCSLEHSGPGVLLSPLGQVVAAPPITSQLTETGCNTDHWILDFYIIHRLTSALPGRINHCNVPCVMW
uniref:Uncharacterized protein n=1 Tax=Engystomops pustulosus TaxID=76066 RepID=A0AAV6YG11_ENGPU|nr:hypothetical protein GDO81_027363 [Engystomops pustulosus]